MCVSMSNCNIIYSLTREIEGTALKSAFGVLIILIVIRIFGAKRTNRHVI